MKARFFRTILVPEKNIQIKIVSVGAKIPNPPLCEMYRLATLLMRWSDLNIFRKYQFRIMGCSL